jgi:signal transduction histidine kinase
VSSWRDRPTEWLLAAGVVPVAVYLFVGGPAQDVIYGTIGAVAALTIVVGTQLHRPSRPLPWWLFAAGTALFAIADDINDAMGDDLPVPSLPDAFYLAGEPLLVLGLLLLVFQSGGHRRLAALGDAAILTLAFVLVQWVFVIDAIVDGPGSAGERTVSALYPIMDIALLAGLAGFFVTAAWRTASFTLLVGSILLLLAADEAFSLGLYAGGTWPDVLWLLSYLLWAAAALHPSMRRLSVPARRPSERLGISTGRVLLLTAALLTTPAVLLVQHLRGIQPPIVPAVVAASLISVLVVLRLLGLLRVLEHAQRLLEAQNERLREADRMKDEFVALISHDLRTPLTSIMGYVELSLDEELEPDTRSYLEVVARSSQRLLRLVDDLLFVARLQSGRLELAPTRLDLSEIARQSAQEARGRADAKDLHLVVDANGDVPIEADRGRVFQLLDNLVSNAIKFTPDGGTVQITVAREQAAVLEVCDTGIGFTSAEAQLIFDRFYRTDVALSRQVPGTGLGLFIAAAITEAHGGQISAHPREGGGAVFRVELPLARA